MYKWSTSANDFIEENEGDVWSSGVLGYLPDTAGTYYLYVRSYNAAGVGNGSVKFGPYELLTDTTGPSLWAEVVASKTGQAPNYRFLKGTVTINATAEDSESGVKAVQYRIDSGPFVAMASSEGGYIAEFEIDASWANGQHSVTIRATDGADNYSDVVKQFEVNKNEMSGLVAMQESVSNMSSRAVTFVLTYIQGGVEGKLTQTIFPSFVLGRAGYSFTDIPDGLKYISAKTAWHLRRRIEVTPVNGQSVANFTGEFELLGGDLATPGQSTGDNAVNALDYAILRNAWGDKPAGDITGDGFTDNDDYLVMSANWYKKGDSE
jgi:hypothetical protein